MLQCLKNCLYLLTFVFVLVWIKLFIFDFTLREKVLCGNNVNPRETLIVSLEEFSSEGANSDNVTDGEMLEFADLMAERRRKVAEICQSSNLNKMNTNHRNFIELMLMKEKRILYCPIYKASSSTWLTYLFDISGSIRTEEQKNRFKKKLGSDNVLKMANVVTTRVTDVPRFVEYVKLLGPANLKSFMIVRHPFHRLVSAFRDKLERKRVKKLERDYFYKKYGKQIVAKYRKSFTKQFSEEYLSESNNYGAPVPVVKKTNTTDRSPLQPTFWEFVQFVKDTKPMLMDEHWKPMHLFCPVCDIDFAYVLKFENIPEEGKFLRKVLNPFDDRRHLLRKVNKNHPMQMNETALVSVYFDMLSESDVEELFKIYELDFRMYGYEFEFKGKVYPDPDVPMTPLPFDIPPQMQQKRFILPPSLIVKPPQAAKIDTLREVKRRLEAMKNKM